MKSAMTMMTHCFVGLILVAAFGAARQASAIDYYVSPAGDDDAAGTSLREAFRTVSKAAAVAGAGDVVNIAPGTYAERVRVINSGTAEMPLTFRGHGDGEVIVTQPGPATGSWLERRAFGLENRDHVVIEGLTFRDCHAWIAIWDSDHCTVRDCVFDGAGSYNCLRINNGSHNRILRCTFKRATTRTGFREGSTWIPVPGADYIEIFRSSHNNLVEDCTFGPINHVAVSISAVEPDEHSPTRNIVRSCVFTDPYWKCLWVHAGAHNVFEDCVCTGQSAAFVQLESGTTIIRRNQFLRYRDSTGAQPDVTFRGAIRMQYDAACHNRIYANLFYGNERTLTNSSYRWHVFDNVFKNNAFFRNGQTILLGFPDYRAANRNYFHHNLIEGVAPGQEVIQLARDRYTLQKAQAQMPDLYAGNIEGDPLFRDPDADDYRLKDGSPCIDAGAALTCAAGSGRGALVTVQDALYFCDGNGLVEGDQVVVGGNAPARLLKVDYAARTLALDREIAWADGDAVHLPYAGSAPDIGPHEFGPP